jgi:hypothetical protein
MYQKDTLKYVTRLPHFIHLPAYLPACLPTYLPTNLVFIFFITPVYLQSVQNTMSKWEEIETNGEEESSVTLIRM